MKKRPFRRGKAAPHIEAAKPLRTDICAKLLCNDLALACCLLSKAAKLIRESTFKEGS